MRPDLWAGDEEPLLHELNDLRRNDTMHISQYKQYAG